MGFSSELNPVFSQNAQGREITSLRDNASPSSQVFYAVLRDIYKFHHSC